MFQDDGAEDNTMYEAVMNDEEQYSIWPTDRALPSGWRTTGFQGSRAACLEHIDEVWTDMRPRSLREAMKRIGPTI